MTPPLEPSEIDYAEQLRHAGREEQEEYCLELMMKMHWYGPDSIRALARIWDLTNAVVLERSRAARVQFRDKLGSPEDLRSRFVEQLEFVAADALRRRKAIKDGSGAIQLVPHPDHASAIRAIDVAAGMVGLKTVSPPNVDSKKQYDQQTAAELIEEAQRKGILSPRVVEAIGESDATERIPSQLSGVACVRQSERVRGGHARRTQDPTLGRDSAGGAKQRAKHPVHSNGVRVHGPGADREASTRTTKKGDHE